MYQFILAALAALVAAQVGCNSAPPSGGPRTGALTHPDAAPTPSLPRPAIILRNPGLQGRPRALAAPSSPSSAQASSPYPPAAWRLAPRAVLTDTVLWFDQILIQHAAVRNESSFNLAYWFGPQPTPQRSRDDALTSARAVAAEAATDPDRFGAIARRVSDDFTSRDEGGALGGVWASELADLPHVLDALAALPPGAVSKVVETNYGFHIFRRREPPAAEIVSGAHIVIGHDDAEWLEVVARGPLPSRSRDDARALAQRLYREASEHPEHFGQLVEHHSEHRDARVGGDMGNWSTREPTMFPGRLRRLGQLALGEVGAPVETHLGFEVILRTAPVPRQQLAARVFRLEFDPSALEGADTSRAAVFALASEIAREMAAEPARFTAELPTAVLQWEDGRESPALSECVKSLTLGAVSPEPVLTEFSFKIVQRLPPEPVPSVTYHSELPAPERVDRLVVGEMPVAALQAVLRATEHRARVEHIPPAGTKAPLDWLDPGFMRLDESASYETKITALREFLAQVRRQLGPQRYSSYDLAFERELRDALLDGPSDPVTTSGP